MKADRATKKSKPASIPAELKSRIGSVPKKIESFVGKVEGTNAYIGVVDRDGEIEAFVCDGAAATWLTGAAKQTTLSAAADGATLKAVRDGASLTGTVTFAGADHNFTAATCPYPANLWEATELNDGRVVRAGWIVLPDGTQRGAGQIGKAIVRIAPVDPSTAAQAISIGGTGGTATPSEPVPFQKFVGVKWSQTCDGMEQTWDILMSVVNNPNATEKDRTAAGNAAAAIYRKAMWKGCAWAPDPSTQTM